MCAVQIWCLKTLGLCPLNIRLVSIMEPSSLEETLVIPIVAEDHQHGACHVLIRHGCDQPQARRNSARAEMSI